MGATLEIGTPRFDGRSLSTRSDSDCGGGVENRFQKHRRLEQTYEKWNREAGKSAAARSRRLHGDRYPETHNGCFDPITHPDYARRISFCLPLRLVMKPDIPLRVETDAPVRVAVIR